MAGSDLVVDFELLNKSAKQLGLIEQEFRNLEDWKDDITTVVGASEIRKAMGDFIDNWDKNRKRLVKSVDEVGKMVEDTRNAFKKLDDDLAKAGKGKGK